MFSPAEYTVAGTILMLGGTALFWVLVPRPGRPESWWLSTEVKALLVAVLVLGLVVFGGVLLAKGLLG